MPSIEIKTIENAVVEKIKEKNGGRTVGIRHKVSTHVGGAANVPPFIVELNNSEPFESDGIRVVFGDMVPDPTVLQLIVAYAVRYKEKGWDVK